MGDCSACRAAQHACRHVAAAAAIQPLHVNSDLPVGLADPEPQGCCAVKGIPLHGRQQHTCSVGQVCSEQPEGGGSCTLPRKPHSKQQQVAVVEQAQPGVRILMHARLAAGRPAAGALLVHGMIAWMCVAPPLRQCMRLREHCGHGWQWGTQVLGPGCALVAGGPVAPHWVHSCSRLSLMSPYRFLQAGMCLLHSWV